MNRSLLNWNARARDAWVRTQAARIAPGSCVLDIGAGGCPYRDAFAHCTYLTQDAALLQDDALAEGGYGAIDLRCDAIAIPLPDGACDAILCTEVLEHVPEPARVVAEAARLLRPDGTLLLTAPLGSGLHQEPHHYYGGYTPHWYRMVLGNCGFHDIRIQSNGGSLRHFAQWCLQMPLSLACDNVAQGPTHRVLGVLAGAALLPFVTPAALIALIADPLDTRRQFTCGYHVIATRSSTAS